MENRNPREKNLAERDAEATDKETLDDLEEAFGSGNSEQKDQKNVPSPDGSFDEGKELEEADPM